MPLLFGAEAIDYATRSGRAVFVPHPSGRPELATPLAAAAARDLPEAQRGRLFLALAYSGYVVTDQDEILLQRVADNPWGFELTDGAQHWPGGRGKAAKVMPVKAGRVPEALRARLDPLRDGAASIPESQSPRSPSTMPQ
jgi:hypothetical protein